MDTDAQRAGVVRIFSDKLSNDGTFSLDLLRAIDGTVDSLQRITAFLRPNRDFAAALSPTLEACAFSEPLDPDKIIVGNLRQAIEKMTTVRENLQQGLRTAEGLTQLEHYQESLVDAYGEATAVATELIDLMGELCAATERHDAALEEVIGPFTDVEKLLDRLGLQ